MSITVYIDDWHKQPSTQKKSYLTDQYTGLDEDDFSGYGYEQDDTGRYYEMQTVYENPFPEMNFCNGNWREFSEVLNLTTTDGVGSVSANDVGGVLLRAIVLLNSHTQQAKLVRPAEIDGRMMTPGTTMGYARRRAGEFVELLKFAADRNKGIYWG